MSIVNPGGLPRYCDIEERCRKMAEEVILNKSSDGNHVERFLEYAEEVKRPPAPAAAGPVLRSRSLLRRSRLNSCDL